MSEIRLRNFSMWLLLIAGLLISCSPKSTPPGASSIGGSVGATHYSYHYWEEGLAVLIWHDFSYGGESCSGTGSTEDPVYRLECGVEAQDGRRFEWNLHTSDGVTADMWIENQSFDLSQGKMFLVSSQDGGVEVVQLQRDFSEIEDNYQMITAMASSDPDVANFVESVASMGEPTGEPADDSKNIDTSVGLGGIINALNNSGLPVELAGQVAQPFFSVPGQIIAIGDEEVQIFEFPDATQAEAEATQISPDASSVGTTMLSWVATPHFYLKDNFIILYVGENDAVTGALNVVLGEPIAEGQGANISNELAGEASDVGLSAALPEALASGDFAALEGMMGDSFNIGYWRSEGQALTPAEAIEQLQSNLLPDSTKLKFMGDLDLFPDLGEFDPKAAFGPDVHIVDLLYSKGWGVNGQSEAILVIAEDANGNQYWPGIIYSFDGFTSTTDHLPQQPALSFDAATYRNEANGFEFYYPAAWSFEEQVLGSRGSGALFTSDGETVFSAIVYLWDPKNDLDAYSAQRKLGWSSSSTVTAEEELMLSGGQRALTFEIQGPDGSMSYSLLTEIGEKYLELFGNGDRELLGEIFQTLRIFEPSASEPVLDLAAFENQVMAAVKSKDLSQLQAFMDESFGFAFWGSEGYERTSEEAIEQFRQNYLSSDQTINFDVDAPDLGDILGPPGILSVWDPARNPVDALFSTGWGPDGQDEAFLIIIQKPDGSYAWDGIILASGSYGGFEGLYDQPN